MHMEKSNLLAVSIIVQDESGNILLKKRAKEPDEGKWELFAGYPYLNEMPLEKAIRRILRERAGLSEIESCEFSGKYYDAHGRHPGKACIPLVFKVIVQKSAVTTDTLRWFGPEELESLPMALDNRAALSDLRIVK
jgi:ADP-ribose pyrophosphatase YjhB (NUDIX family)